MSIILTILDKYDTINYYNFHRRQTMGKPSFTIWVGWKRDSFDAQLQEDDYEKFPKELKALYKGELSTLQALSGVIIDGLKFEIID